MYLPTYFMALRYALLAALSASPRTGYDLVGICDCSVDGVWYPTHPQIYGTATNGGPGFIAAREIPRGEKGKKREYRLTDTGLSELR